MPRAAYKPKNAASKKKPGRPRKHFDWNYIRDLARNQLSMVQIASKVSAERDHIYKAGDSHFAPTKFIDKLAEWREEGIADLRVVAIERARAGNDKLLIRLLEKYDPEWKKDHRERKSAGAMELHQTNVTQENVVVYLPETRGKLTEKDVLEMAGEGVPVIEVEAGNG